MLGAAIALLLPTGHGQLGLVVAASVLSLIAITLMLRERALRSHRRRRVGGRPAAEGSLAE